MESNEFGIVCRVRRRMYKNSEGNRVSGECRQDKLDLGESLWIFRCLSFWSAPAKRSPTKPRRAKSWRSGDGAPARGPGSSALATPGEGRSPRHWDCALAPGRAPPRLRPAWLRRVELTHFTHIDSITWSPDGAYIAGIFRGPQPKEGKTGIFTVPADSGEHQILLHVGAIRPHPGGGLRGIPTWYSSGSASRRWLPKRIAGLRWSPDSSHLAFSSDMDEDGAFYVYTLPRKGGSPLALGATRSAWPQQVMWRWVTK